MWLHNNNIIKIRFLLCPIKLNGDTLECVDKFCYLGDMIGSGGGADDAFSMRVKCAWGKFRELSPILTAKEGFAEAERKSLSDLCSERVGVWKPEVGNEDRGHDDLLNGCFMAHQHNKATSA